MLKAMSDEAAISQSVHLSAMAKLRTQEIFSMAASQAGNFQSEAMKWLRL